MARLPRGVQMGGPPSRFNNGYSVWPIVISAVALLLTLVGGFWSLANPREDIKQIRDDLRASIAAADAHLQDELKQLREDLNKEITKNEAELNDTRVRAAELIKNVRDSTVSLREHEEFAKREDSRIAVIERVIEVLREAQVTRNEHVQHWNETDNRINSLRDGLNELRHDSATSFTVSDALKQLQKEIDDLRLRSTAPVISGTPSAVTVPVLPVPQH